MSLLRRPNNCDISGGISAEASFATAAQFATIPNLFTDLSAENNIFTDAPMTIAPSADSQNILKWRSVGSDATVMTAIGATPPIWRSAANGIGGLPALQFGDSGSSFAASMTGSFIGGLQAQPTTMFLVVKPLTIRNGRTLVGGVTFANREDVLTNGTTFSLYGGGAEIIIFAQVVAPQIICVTWNGASSTYGKNSANETTVSSTPGANGLAGYSIGAANDGSGAGDFLFGRVLLYNRLLTLAERNLVKSYLTGKYGIV